MAAQTDRDDYLPHMVFAFPVRHWLKVLHEAGRKTPGNHKEPLLNPQSCVHRIRICSKGTRDSGRVEQCAEYRLLVAADRGVQKNVDGRFTRTLQGSHRRIDGPISVESPHSAVTYGMVQSEVRCDVDGVGKVHAASGCTMMLQ